MRFDNNYDALVDGDILRVHLSIVEGDISYNHWKFQNISIDKIQSLIPVFDNISGEKKFNNVFNAQVEDKQLSVQSMSDELGIVVYGYWALEKIPIDKIQSLIPIFEK